MLTVYSTLLRSVVQFRLTIARSFQLTANKRWAWIMERWGWPKTICTGKSPHSRRGFRIEPLKEFVIHTKMIPDFPKLLYMMRKQLSGLGKSRFLVVSVGNRCFFPVNDDWIGKVFTSGFLVLVRCVRIGDGLDVANRDPSCKRLDIRIRCLVFCRRGINWGPRKSIGDGMLAAFSPNCFEDIWRQPFFETLQFWIYMSPRS